MRQSLKIKAGCTQVGKGQQAAEKQRQFALKQQKCKE
jgi:hypothetical protein